MMIGRFIKTSGLVLLAMVISCTGPHRCLIVSFLGHEPTESYVQPVVPANIGLEMCQQH